MLSILIPTFQYNAYPLAKSLVDQALKLNIDFELICRDDGADNPDPQNEKINQLPHSKFIATKKNKGLAHNRNQLAELARFEHLLFIDSDSILTDASFLKNYVDGIIKKNRVIYGGRVHPERVDPIRKLRWKYGRSHEDQDVLKRKKNPYKTCLFNNTLISKCIFNQIKFDVKLAQYGHEDTLFAYYLSLLGVDVHHINNPVLHGDVDPNSVFLEKTKKALENLHYLNKNQLIDKNFIRALTIYHRLKSVNINYIVAFLHFLLNPIYKINLVSKTPSLRLFNLFRLTYFCRIALKK